MRSERDKRDPGMSKTGTTDTDTAKSAFLATIPVLLGYSAIGIAFGLLVVASGFPWWVVLIMSVFVYAGAGQFIGVEFLPGAVESRK